MNLVINTIPPPLSQKAELGSVSLLSAFAQSPVIPCSARNRFRYTMRTNLKNKF